MFVFAVCLLQFRFLCAKRGRRCRAFLLEAMYGYFRKCVWCGVCLYEDDWGGLEPSNRVVVWVHALLSNLSHTNCLFN